MIQHRVLGCVLLAACSGDPCELARVAECADCGPGEVRHAFVIGDDRELPSLDRTSAGIACTVCDSVLLLDGAFEARPRLSFELGPTREVSLQVAAGGGDTTYVLQTDNGERRTEPEVGPVPVHTLIALDAEGAERWRQELGAFRDLESLSAGPEGPYISRRPQSAGPLATTALDTDGNLRWSGSDFELLVPDGAGGVVTATKRLASGDPTAETTIEGRDGAGARRWARTWRTEGAIAPDRPSVIIEQAAAGPGGQVAVVGTFTGSSLDFGDRVLAQRGSRSVFIALLGADGATRWAFAREWPNVQRRSIAFAGDQVIFGGHYNYSGSALGLPDASGIDSFVAVAGPDGLVRPTLLGGRGDQLLTELRAGPAGTVTVLLTNLHGETIGGQLQIGSTTFASGDESDDQNHTYLLDLLP